MADLTHKARNCDGESVIAKSKLGTRRICPACETPFYDLNAEEVACPSCGRRYIVTSAALIPTGEDNDNATYSGPARWLSGDDGVGNIFLTGRAGTGKTTLLKQFLERNGQKTVILAPTGVAAMNVGGQTIHSFFKFPPRLLDAGDVKRLRNAKLVKAIDTMVIDEISMVRADMLDAIDRSLKLNRGSKRPFGGVRMILSGDLHQLPPVVQNDEAPILEETYGGAYFHRAEAFQTGDFSLVALKHVFRQRDPAFLDLLNSLRNGRVTETDQQLLEELVSERSSIDASDTHVVLTPNNAAAYRINQARLAEIGGEPHIFEANIDGEFDNRSQPTEAELELKAGARVMIIKNDPEGRWVNGSIGHVEGFDDDGVLVSLEGEVHRISPAVWEKYRYALEPGSEKVSRSVIGSFKQLPLRLAYAVTIHKAQGLTLPKVYIDFDNGMFAHGQAYVAFSRAQTLDGLELSRALRPRDLRLDRSAFAFGQLETVDDHDNYMLARFKPPEDQLL